MGRATRWLKGVFGGKKVVTSSPAAVASKEKKQRWGSFVKSFREKKKISEASPVTAAEVDEEEQNKRAIAVAAAVVSLTSNGRTAGAGGGGRGEDAAAIKIQAAFRAYLARRALKALKGLVKLQALVRGNIVRKNTVDTMRSMQALVRVQARARASRALRSDLNQLRSSFRSHPGPSAPDKWEQPVRSNSRRSNRSSPLKRNSLIQTSSNESSGLPWLDQWLGDCYYDTSKSTIIPLNAPLEDKCNTKVLEIDTGKPSERKSNNYRRSSCSPLASDQYIHSFTTVPDSPSKDDSTDQSVTPLRFPVLGGCDYGESPQFFSASSSRPGSSKWGPFTPAKSDCSRSLFSGYSDCPNYMANTESSRAKFHARSQSAPKQRPELERLESTRLVSGGNGLGLGPLHDTFAKKGYPGSGRLDRLGVPLRI